MPLEGEIELKKQDRFLNKLSKILLHVGDEDGLARVADRKEEWFRLLYPLVKEKEAANKAQGKGVKAVERYHVEVKSRMFNCLNQAMDDPEVKAVIISSKTGQELEDTRPALIDLGVGGVKLIISPGPTKGQLTIEISENSPPDKKQKWQEMIEER